VSKIEQTCNLVAFKHGAHLGGLPKQWTPTTNHFSSVFSCFVGTKREQRLIFHVVEKRNSLTHIVLTTNTIIIIKCVRNLLVLSLNVSNFCQLVLIRYTTVSTRRQKPHFRIGYIVICEIGALSQMCSCQLFWQPLFSSNLHLLLVMSPWGFEEGVIRVKECNLASGCYFGNSLIWGSYAT
jgi:hypothetical protein